jgi:hypothetical protein
MAEDQATATAKKALAEGKEVRAAQDAQRSAIMKGKPTPTQEELDLINLGGHPTIEEDGSPEEKSLAEQHATRHSEASKPASGGYQTRASTATQSARAKSE